MIFVSFYFLSLISLRSFCWCIYYESMVQHCHRLFHCHRQVYTVQNRYDRLYTGPFSFDRFRILLISSVIWTDRLTEIVHLFPLLCVYDVQRCVDHVQFRVGGLYTVCLASHHSLYSIFLGLKNRIILTALSYRSNCSHTTHLYNVSIYYVATHTMHI